jgi:imidazolonepropionase-like amidohydrolase
MRRAMWAIVGMMILWALPPTGWASDERGTLVLVHGLLIDGTGAEPVPDAAVVVRNGRIVAVGPSSGIEVPGGARIIDVQGAAILPGFINAHVHHGYDESNLRAWAQAGVTTVRDLGTQSRWASSGSGVFEDRDGLNAEPINARLVAAGPIVTTVGGYGGHAVTSTEDARDKVNELIDRGADLVKIAIEDDLQGRRWPMLTAAEMAAIVEAAHLRGVRVAAHVSRAEHVRMAIEAGVNDVNHMAIDPVPADVLERMVGEGMAWVPTLELWDGVSRRYGLTWDATAAWNLRRFVEAGGIVALGTDYDGYTTPFDLGMPVTEIRLMHDAGMTPMQIIEAATRNAAAVCGLADTLGTIEVGKIADVIVVRGNPLDDVLVLQEVTVVIHNGVVIRSDR